MATPEHPVKPPLPQSGGSYTREPRTGRITKRGEDPKPLKHKEQDNDEKR